MQETDGGKVRRGRGRERTIEVGEEKMKVKDEARCPIELLMHTLQIN